MSEATITAVSDAVELNDLIDSEGAERTLLGEQTRRANVRHGLESSEHNSADASLRDTLDDALGNDAADSGVETAGDREDATEAVQEQEQSQNGPQG